jgi:transposase-like protein
MADFVIIINLIYRKSFMKKYYTEEFKEKTIQYILSNPGIGLSKIARQLDVSYSTIYAWKKKHHVINSSSPDSDVTDKRRIVKLEKQLKEVTEMFEALKKTHVCFIKNMNIKDL